MDSDFIMFIPIFLLLTFLIAMIIAAIYISGKQMEREKEKKETGNSRKQTPIKDASALTGLIFIILSTFIVFFGKKSSSSSAMAMVFAGAILCYIGLYSYRFRVISIVGLLLILVALLFAFFGTIIYNFL